MCRHELPGLCRSWNAFSNWTMSVWRQPGRWLRQRSAIDPEKARILVRSMIAHEFTFSSFSSSLYFWGGNPEMITQTRPLCSQEKGAPASWFQRLASMEEVLLKLSPMLLWKASCHILISPVFRSTPLSKETAGPRQTQQEHHEPTQADRTAGETAATQ